MQRPNTPLLLSALALAALLHGCGTHLGSDGAPATSSARFEAAPDATLDGIGYSGGSTAMGGFVPNQTGGRPAFEPTGIQRLLDASNEPTAGLESMDDETDVLEDPEATELLVIERAALELERRTDIAGSGEMLVTLADEIASLPLEHTSVSIEVLGPVASGRVTQRFTNPYDEPIEARYVFPLPHDAAVHDFVLTIGERRIRGIVREREEARRIYEAARRQGYTAALMTQERPNVFTQNVANILPGAPIDVTLAYLEPVDVKGEWYELAFPIVVGPRYNPVGHDAGIGAKGRSAGGTGQPTDVTYLRPETRPSADIDLEVRLDVGLAVERLSSPSHDVTVEESPSGALVALAPGARIPNRDFVLRWRVAGDGVRTALVREEDHALLTLYPPTDLTELPRRPVEHHFVIDTSGSMSGEPMTVVRGAMHAALDRLDPRDTFHIMEFSATRRALSRASLPATEKNVAAARRYVDQLEGSGGTEMLPAVQEALARPADGQRKRVVTFFTDGYIGNEDEILAAIQRREADARFFCFAVGSSPNRWLLAEMARRSEGSEAWVNIGQDPTSAIEGYFERVSHPAVEELDVRFEGVSDVDLADRLPRSLFAGRPVTLPVRLEGAEGPVRVIVEGLVDGQPTTLADVSAAPGAPPAGRRPILGKVWARARLARHMADLRTAGAPRGAEIGTTMTALALEHGLVSSTTSFVCVDSAAPVTEGGDPEAVDVAVPVPAGVEFATTVKDG